MFVSGICSRRSLIFQMAVKHRVPNTTCLWTEHNGSTISSRPRITSQMPNRLYECQLQSVSSSIQSQTSSHRYNLYIQKPAGVYQMYTFFWRFDKNSGLIYKLWNKTYFNIYCFIGTQNFIYVQTTIRKQRLLK